MHETLSGGKVSIIIMIVISNNNVNSVRTAAAKVQRGTYIYIYIRDFFVVAVLQAVRPF